VFHSVTQLHRVRQAAVVGGLVAVAFCTIGAAAAASRARQWHVSGRLVGHYSNSITWVNCSNTGATGTARESVNLDVNVSSRQTAFTSGSGFGLVVKMTPGGNVSIKGSYPPRQVDFDGNVVGCAAQQSFQCQGQIVNNGENGTVATLIFRRKGSAFVGGVSTGPFFVESMFLRYPDKTSICSPDIPTASPFAEQPLLGLANTQMEVDVLGESDARPNDRISIPRAKLYGTKAFTIKHTAGPDLGCSSRTALLFYTDCNESGRIALVLHFKPATDRHGQRLH
jgi:hypothetical protein